MQRSDAKSVRKWNINRSTSIVMIGLAAIGLMFALKIVLTYASETTVNKRLEQIKQEIIEENEYLEHESDLLHDGDYYSIYIREEFQLNGNNVIRLPK